MARRRAYRARIKELGDLYYSRGRVRLEWLDHWARRDRLADDLVPLDDRGRLERADASLDLGQQENAIDYFAGMLKHNASLAATLLDRARFLFRQGRGDTARSLIQAVASNATDAGTQRETRLALEIVSGDEAAGFQPPDVGANQTSERERRWLNEFRGADEARFPIDRFPESSD
jgi:tetratricopeptide (TPR) repeat protein